MRVFRLQCLLFIAVAGLLACGSADAQTQIVQSQSPPCRLWTDGCSICQRQPESGGITCNQSGSRRPGCVPEAVPRCADDPPAQTQIAQPMPWCLRWTDTCTTCERWLSGSEIRCIVSRRGQGAGCIAGAARCVKADNAALKDACEEAKEIREECNSCTAPAPGRPSMCTLKLCAVKEVVCVKPKT